MGSYGLFEELDVGETQCYFFGILATFDAIFLILYLLAIKLFIKTIISKITGHTSDCSPLESITSNWNIIVDTYLQLRVQVSKIHIHLSFSTRGRVQNGYIKFAKLNFINH